jgi:hypothetical protein
MKVCVLFGQTPAYAQTMSIYMNVVQTGHKLARIVMVGFEHDGQPAILEHLKEKFECEGDFYTNLFRERNIYLLLRPHQQKEVADEIRRAGFAENIECPVTFSNPDTK